MTHYSIPTLAAILLARLKQTSHVTTSQGEGLIRALEAFLQ